MYTTLVSPSVLANHLNDASWCVIDCRFDLAAPDRGEQQFQESRIPGARYAHLDRDLSGDKDGTNGRHPLPPPADMIARFSRLGVENGAQVVVYDGDSSMFAARLWWMLRFMGHEGVAVLDGGFARWTAEGRPVTSGRSKSSPTAFRGLARQAWRLGVDEVVAGLGDPGRLLVDGRANDRYRGLNETIDKVAGHIPGALNYPFQNNLSPENTFKPAAELRTQWDAVLKGRDPREVVMYCGSGVSACHNLLAMEIAGLSGARLFPGSWSEWSSNPSRPIATGEK